MSANLLAELDSFYGGGGVSQEAAAVQRHGVPIPHVNHPVQEDDEDEFGEFEGPGPQSVQAQSTELVSLHSPRKPMEYDSWADTQWSSTATTQTSRPAPLRADSLAILGNSRPTDIMNQATSDVRPQRRQIQRPKKPRDDSVLFDASEDEDDEDGFGDLETSASVKQASETRMKNAAPQVTLNPIEERRIWVPESKKAAPNLLDLDAEDNMLGEDMASLRVQDTKHLDSLPQLRSHKASPAKMYVETQAGQLHPSRPRQDGLRSSGTAPSSIKIAPITTRQTAQEDDFGAWDDFEETSAPSPPAMSTQHTASEGASPPLPRLLKDISTSEAVPPSNIPPPVVIFTLFAPIFKTAQTDFLEPFTQAVSNPTERNQIAQTPAVMQYLQDYISIATTCAHLISGRKSRWKRDAILSQSMRIGPASASGKSGGMKLTGIDKSENAKEEREAADVVAAWRRQLGKLRTATTGIQGLPRIPDINDAMPVRMATSAEGALSSPKPCVLCGIKRNERVNKVDVDVQDSFGEWWIEHWGHHGCMAFWEMYRDKLAGR